MRIASRTAYSLRFSFRDSSNAASFAFVLDTRLATLSTRSLLCEAAGISTVDSIALSSCGSRCHRGRGSKLRGYGSQYRKCRVVQARKQALCIGDLEWLSVIVSPMTCNTLENKIQHIQQGAVLIHTD